MSIRFLCPFGHHLVVPDERAGKKGRCPVCHQKVYVPVANPQPRTHHGKPSDEVEIASDGGATTDEQRAASLDEILAEELGLDLAAPEQPSQALPPKSMPKPAAATSPPPKSPPAAHAPSAPPASPPASTPFSPSGLAPYASHSDVPPPSAKAPKQVVLSRRTLTSPARPVADAIPPHEAMPPAASSSVAANVPVGATEALVPPSLPPAANGAEGAKPAAEGNRPTTWSKAVSPVASMLPPAASAASPPMAGHLPPAALSAAHAPAATSIATPPMASQLPPPLYPATPINAPTPPLATPSLPTPHSLLPTPFSPAARIFRADESMPWLTEADDAETQIALGAQGGWTQTAWLLSVAMLAAMGIGLIPVFKFWTTDVMPQWGLVILGVSCVELALAIWLATLPDWSILGTAAVVCGLVAAGYASGMALIISNQSATTLPLDLYDVRNFAGGWCTGSALCWGMLSYALMHNGRLWKRGLRRLLRPV